MILNYGPRLKEFAYRPIELDRRLNILDGSVRSGKTWAIHPKILRGCVYPVDGWRFITGQTKETIYTNVLYDLFRIIGPRHYHYNHQSGLLRLFNSIWKVMGAKDEGSEKFVRGSTIGFAVCDEVVLMPKSFFQMLLTRMSPKGAKFYGTTNPDQPMHWLKTEYLDNPVVQAHDLYHLHCTMDDNPNLPEEYKETLKRLYKGLFYQRFILGLWIMAEGSIWGDAWSDDLLYCDVTCMEPHQHSYAPITLKNAGGFVDRWIANDYGTAHPHVYGEFWDDGQTVWLDREWVWDSKEQMRQLTDGQYADALIEFMGRNNGCQVIIPPEALSFQQECINRGIWVTDANNEVTEGIQTVSGMMATKRFRVNRNCKRCLRGIQTHVWDPNKAKRGLEEPLKQDDDEADMIRYGLHSKIQKWRYTT